MIYLKRKIDAFLTEWKNNPDRKPLIVKGASGWENRIDSAVWKQKLSECDLY